MDTNTDAWWPFGLFIYALMFSFLLVPAVILGTLCLKRGVRLLSKIVGGVTVFVLPVAGFLLYMQIDRFESMGRQAIWWILMWILHIAPVVACGYFLYQGRQQLKGKHKQ